MTIYYPINRIGPKKVFYQYLKYLVTRAISLKAASNGGTWSYNQYLYALEQENYCDFEVDMTIYYPISNTGP